MQTQNKLTCASCHASDSCGNGIIERFFAGRMFETLVKNSLEAKIGDRLLIEMMKTNVTKASFIVYLLPILLMLMSAMLSNFFSFSENQIILTSLSGLSLGILIAAFFNRSIQANSHYHPQMRSIIGHAIEQKALADSIEIKRL